MAVAHRLAREDRRQDGDAAACELRRVRESVMLRVPVSTYRIQFNASFTFQDARSIVSYLADLGITDIYASPILKARKGSAHGYDVVDASALNPELGTEEDFTQLHNQLETH